MKTVLLHASPAIVIWLHNKQEGKLKFQSGNATLLI